MSLPGQFRRLARPCLERKNEREAETERGVKGEREKVGDINADKGSRFNPQDQEKKSTKQKPCSGKSLY